MEGGSASCISCCGQLPMSGEPEFFVHSSPCGILQFIIWLNCARSSGRCNNGSLDLFVVLAAVVFDLRFFLFVLLASLGDTRLLLLSPCNSQVGCVSHADLEVLVRLHLGVRGDGNHHGILLDMTAAARVPPSF